MVEKTKREEQNKPALALVVVEPFDGYERGDRITDTNKMKAILASENAGHVHTVML